MFQFCDAHLHLTRADPPRLEAWRAAGLAGAVSATAHYSEWPAALEWMKQTPPWVHFALGVHPWHVAEAPEDALAELDALLGSRSALAVGEIGLDFADGRDNRERQLYWFEAQLALAREESGYIERVKDSLDRAEGESEINEIREELEAGGYLRQNAKNRRQKPKKPAPDEYRTAGGYLVYCGKNNLQNEYITFKLAQRSDIWFHVKDRPGSHVLLVTEGKEPSVEDYTQAATIAAVCSSASGDASVTVDYTRAGEVKKPSGSKPGYVIYHKNFSTLVRRDEALVRSLRVK